MSTTDVLVILAGLGAIAWVYWYFFAAKPTARATDQGGVQQVRIEVHGSYDPAVIHVRSGRPVRLDFHRSETSSCTEEVVMPAFGVRRFLPAHQTTSIEVTPPRPGTYEFMCGMSMVHGQLVAE